MTDKAIVMLILIGLVVCLAVGAVVLGSIRSYWEGPRSYRTQEKRSNSIWGPWS